MTTKMNFFPYEIRILSELLKKPDYFKNLG